MLHRTTLIIVSCFFVLNLFSQDLDFFDDDIVIIELTFDAPHWHDTLSARKQSGEKRGLLGVAKINGELYENVEVRFKGNSSFHAAVKHGVWKLPLRIKAAKGELFAGKYKVLRLGNNYGDPSAIRELLAYEIAETYVPTPRVAPASVNVNGTFFGVYTVTERIDESMLSRYFCNTEGILIQCEPDYTKSYVTGCPKGEYANLKYLGEELSCYDQFYDLENTRQAVAIVSLTKRLAYQKDLGAFLNVHQTLWMHALNNTMVNLDSYLGLFCHNYFVYQDENGIYNPLIWDLNLAFGGFSSIGDGVKIDMPELSPLAHDRYLAGRRPLIQKLLSNKENAQLYFWMIHTILEDWFLSEKYIEVAESYQDDIRPFLTNEKEGLYTMTDFDQSLTGTVKVQNSRTIMGVSQLMEKRTEYLTNHPLLQRDFPEITDWSLGLIDEGRQLKVSTTDGVNRVAVFYRNQNCGVFSKVEMTLLANGEWEVGLPSKSQFYFIISSESGNSLFPSHAPLQCLVTE